MYNVTNQYINAALDRTREISIKAVFNGTTEVDSSNIVDLTFEELCVAGDNPTMGEACSNKVVINMYAPENPPEYKSGFLNAYIGLTVNEDVEWCPLGQFFISEYTSTDDYKTVQITAYDKMAMLNDDYTYTAPTTVSAVMSDIASKYDITVEDVDYPEGNLINTVVKCSVRQMIGYIAGLMGKNARFNKDGNLEFFWYSTEAVIFGDVNDDGNINSADIDYINSNLINTVTGEEYESILGSATVGISYLGGVYSPDAFSVDVNSDHIIKADDVAEIQAYIDGHPYNPTIVGTKEYPYKITQSNISMGGFTRLSETVYKVERLESGTSKNIITSGTEGRLMSFENPFMTQAILDSIRAALVFEYMPCNISYQGNPAFECGDIIGAVASNGQTYAIPIMSQTFTVSGGMHSEIGSVGTTDVQSAIEVDALTDAIEDATEPLADAIGDLEEMVGDTSVAEQIEASRQEIESAIKSNLENVDGTYRILYNSEGKPYGWDIVSNTDSNKFWRFTYGGMRYTSDGGSTFSTGIDLDGNIYASSSLYASSCYVANTLTAGAVLTNKVTANNLEITGGSIDITAGTSTDVIDLSFGNYHTIIRPSTLIVGNSVINGIVYTGTMIDGAGNIITTGRISASHIGEDGNAPVVYFSTSQTSSAQAGRFSKSGNTFQLTDYSGSSRRFKHDIESLNHEWLDAIHGLYNAEVKRWTYNDDYIVAEDDLYKTETIGLIAEEIADILPTSGITDANGNIENYRERQLINAMLVLIQEQKQQIDRLEERIKVLEDGNI